MNINVTIWQLYSDEINAWLQLLREETNFNNKLVYVLGHNVPPKNNKNLDEVDPYIQIKGSVFPRGTYEAAFNTVLTLEDHKFVADNEDMYSPTKIHKSLSPYESDDNSLHELEEVLTKLYLPQTDADTATK